MVYICYLLKEPRLHIGIHLTRDYFFALFFYQLYKLKYSIIATRFLCIIDTIELLIYNRVVSLL
jgi:hypothetical protein